MKRTVRVRDNIQRSVQSRATVRLRDTCFYVGAGHFTTFGAQVLCEKSSERRTEWSGVESTDPFLSHREAKRARFFFSLSRDSDLSPDFYRRRASLNSHLIRPRVYAGAIVVAVCWILARG